MPKAEADATGSVKIDAAPETVYALITDLDAMAELAEETAVMRWTKGASGATAGATFRGSNRNGRRHWTTTCTVTDAEPGRRFAFDVTHTGVPVARWEYEIAATESGCTVTETTWDRRPGWFARPSFLVTGVRGRGGANSAHIQATLARLKARAERGS
jgi:uncharacterized protein YndB with AHSA1/START domain